MDINIRITGEAGQGVQTTGDLLSRVFSKAGLYVLSTQSYQSRVRGGENSYDVRVSDHEIFSSRSDVDLLVGLTAETTAEQLGFLNKSGIGIMDGDSIDGVAGIDMKAIAKESGGTAMMVNTVAAGAVMAVTGLGTGMLSELLREEFRKKGGDVAEQNIRCAEAGGRAVARHAGKIGPLTPGDAPKYLYSGSRAIGLSAAVSGVKVVSSYPMTPSTGVFTYLAGAAKKYGIAVEQAEDEIAAINLVCGAAYAGVPAMTTTSGGGFALMAEGISLAGMMELPVVVFLSQRPGPATGLPTRTGQEDLLFAVHAGHGVFPKAVFAPGDIKQAYDLTREAFRTAHRFQSPVILMADQFLTDMQKNMAELPFESDPIDRCIVEAPSQDYVRYAITDTGISPRAIPGGDVFVVADSDEHTEDGHLTEDLEVRVRQQDKRMRKGNEMLKEEYSPGIYPEPADEVLLCWGSTYGPCREAVDKLRDGGRSICMIHFARVWPLDGDRIKKLLQGRRVISVEGNSNAQFATLLKQAGALADFETILKYDGLPFTADEIAGRC